MNCQFFIHDHIADFLSFDRMVREEFIRFREQHLRRVPEAYHPPSSAEPSPPSSPPRPVHGVVLGCVVNNVEEFKLWMHKNLPLLNAQGRRCNMSVFREIHRTLEEEPPGKRHTVAVIPVDDQADMSRTISLCLDTIETRGNTSLRIRAFFSGVYVVIGDFDQCDGPRLH